MRDFIKMNNNKFCYNSTNLMVEDSTQMKDIMYD